MRHPLDLQSETERIRAERRKIEQAKEELMKQIKPAGSSSSASNTSAKKDSKSLHMNLPMPVPGLSLPKPVSKTCASTSGSQRSRKEISMTLKGSSRVDAGKQWEVEDDDEEDEINAALESVSKVVDNKVRDYHLY